MKMKKIATTLIALAVATSSLIAQTVEFSSFRVDDAETKSEIMSLIPLRKSDRAAYAEKMNEICERLTPYIDARVKADESGSLNYKEDAVVISGAVRPLQKNPDGYPLNIKVTNEGKPVYASNQLLQPNETKIVAISFSSAILFSRIELTIG